MTTIEQRFEVVYSYPVIFTHDGFDPKNPVLREALERLGQERARVLVILDSGVFETNPSLPEKMEAYSKAHQPLVDFVASPLVIPGGEVCKKTTAETEKICKVIEKNHLCRHSYVLAVGGGAVLDVCGFAAAISHRGIRLIRMPTTTLAQNDAGVGVKNGINAYGRKNYLGTFVPPVAVINDFDFLKTLPEREMRAGLSEAVKVALIKDRAFFDFLYRERHRLAVFEDRCMERMIIRCAELHLEHIGGCGDPFEFVSARPLDFGHWTAHKMEEVTDGAIRHGEAVAIGIALDSLYSHYAGLLSEIDLHRIFTTLEDLGFPLYHWSLRWMDMGKALAEFQEHLGGRLTLPLLSGIGSLREIHEVDGNLYNQCVQTLAARKQKDQHLEFTDLSPARERSDQYLLS